jgi:hypothetical protein
MMPPPKKGRGGLIAIIAIVLLVVIAGGIVAAIALTGKKPATSTGPGASTPTPSIPAGFKKFTGSTFSIAYPSDWKPVGDAQGTSGEEFTSDSGQVFQVTISAGARSGQEDLFNTGFCSVVGNASDATPAAVTIGGQQWHQLDCGEKSSLHAVVESLVYKGTLFSLSYLSPITTFDSDKTQFYTPMEQSFAFLT